MNVCDLHHLQGLPLNRVFTNVKVQIVEKIIVFNLFRLVCKHSIDKLHGVIFFVLFEAANSKVFLTYIARTQINLKYVFCNTWYVVVDEALAVPDFKYKSTDHDANSSDDLGCLLLIESSVDSSSHNQTGITCDLIHSSL